jgi:hypothetical protein
MTNLARLHDEQGLSPWLDDLSRTTLEAVRWLPWSPPEFQA